MTEAQQKINVRSLRDLDRLIAEHIFGWVDINTSFFDENVLEGYPNRKRLYVYPLEIPRYSSDIATAWTIVDKVTNTPPPKSNQWWYFWLDREYIPSVSRFHHVAEFSLKAECELYGVSDSGELEVVGTHDEKTIASFQGSHESLSVAICLAALKTIGIEAELDLDPPNQPS